MFLTGVTQAVSPGHLAPQIPIGFILALEKKKKKSKLPLSVDK